MAERDRAGRAVFTRREFLRTAAMAGAGGIVAGRAAVALGAETVTLPFANGERPMVTFPQKRPLILITTRPPQLETPFAIFNEGLLTPNDAFFVRYHLAQVPTSIDRDKFTVAIKGKVNSPLTLSLADLKGKFDAVEIV